MFFGFAAWSFAQRASWASRGTDVTPTSWYRNPAENKAVGGKQFSQHLVGWAVDVVGEDQQAFAKRARIAGLTVVMGDTHTHVQLFPPGILRSLLGIASAGRITGPEEQF
jgi:hypothetical protein